MSIVLAALALAQLVSPNAGDAKTSKSDAREAFNRGVNAHNADIEILNCGTSNEKCQARLPIFDNERTGSCLKKVLPNIRFIYRGIPNGTVNFAASVDLFSTIGKNPKPRRIFVKLNSGGLTNICLNSKIIPEAGDIAISYFKRESPYASIDIGGDVTISANVDILAGIAIGDGSHAHANQCVINLDDKKMNQTCIAIKNQYNSSFVDYVFGRSSNTLREIKIKSLSAPLAIFRTDLKIGMTDDTFYAAESALGDIYLLRGTKRVSLMSCKQTKERSFDFIC